MIMMKMIDYKSFLFVSYRALSVLSASCSLTREPIQNRVGPQVRQKQTETSLLV